MDLENRGGVTTTSSNPQPFGQLEGGYGRVRSARINLALNSQLGFPHPTDDFATPYESIKAELQEGVLHGNGRYEAPDGEAAVKGRAQGHRSTTNILGAGAESLVFGAGSLDGIGIQYIAREKRKGKGRAGGDGRRQGTASKRSKHSKAGSVAQANNDRSQVGEEYEEEDEEEEEEEEDSEEGEEDDDGPSPSGPKDSPPFKCPMPSCGKSRKSFNTWNNLIQHLQNTHILGFAFCPYFCGRRFGLSSQYTRHVFKNKSRCKFAGFNVVNIPPSVALSLNYKITKIKRQDYGKLERLIEEHGGYDVEDRNNPRSSTSHIAFNQPHSLQASQDELLLGSLVQVPAGDLQQLIQQLQGYLQVPTPSSTMPPTAASSPKLLKHGRIGGPSDGQQGRPPLHPAGLPQPTTPQGPRFSRGQQHFSTPGISRSSTGGSNDHTDHSIAHHTANSSPVLPKRERNPPYYIDRSLRDNRPSERQPLYQTGPPQPTVFRASNFAGARQQMPPSTTAHTEPLQAHIPSIPGPSASGTGYHTGLPVPPLTGGSSPEFPRQGGNPPRRIGNGPSWGDRRERPSLLSAGLSQPTAFYTPEVGGGREQPSQSLLNYAEPLQPHIPGISASSAGTSAGHAPLSTPHHWSEPNSGM